MKLMIALRLVVVLLVSATAHATAHYEEDTGPKESPREKEKHQEWHLRHRDLSGASNEVCIDFSEAGDGTALKHGDYVRNEWLNTYGMTVEAAAARDGYTPDKMARIYDTTSNAKEDPDLASPNENCGGAGVGRGGEPKQAGANCNPNGEGNVLIIQESNKEEPDDNMRGGTMSFSFTCPVKELKSIGLMDIDKKEKAYFEILKAGGGPGIVQMINGLGDNSIQTETFEGVGQNVKSVDIVVSNSLGVRNICFVPADCSAGTPTLPTVGAPTRAPGPSSLPSSPQSPGSCDVDFRLVNASGDAVYAWADIPFAVPPPRALLLLDYFYRTDGSLDMSFEALLGYGCSRVNSVELILEEIPPDGGSWKTVTSRCERISPYALFGDDTNGNFETFTPSLGRKRLSITAFAGDACDAFTNAGYMIHEFEVKWKMAFNLPGVQFILVRADNGAELCELKPLSGNYLNLAKLPPKLNIRAKFLFPEDEILDPYTALYFILNYEVQPFNAIRPPFVLGANRPVASGETYPDISDILWNVPAWDDPKHNQINSLDIVIKETGRGIELFKTGIAFRLFNDTRPDFFPACESPL